MLSLVNIPKNYIHVVIKDDPENINYLDLLKELAIDFELTEADVLKKIGECVDQMKENWCFECQNGMPSYSIGFYLLKIFKEKGWVVDDGDIDGWNGAIVNLNAENLRGFINEKCKSRDVTTSTS